MAFAKVADLSELEENRPTRVEVDGLPLALVRIEDRVHAILDVCSHEDYPLHEGFVFGQQIECALHGSMFELDSGSPRSLPATSPVPVFAVEIEDGEVRVDPEKQLNDAPMPDHV